MRMVLLFLLLGTSLHSQDFIADVNKDDDIEVVKKKLSQYVENSVGGYMLARMKKSKLKCLALVPNYSLIGSSVNKNDHSEYFFVFNGRNIVLYQEKLAVRQLNAVKEAMNGYHQATDLSSTTKKHYKWSIPCCIVDLEYSSGDAKFEMTYRIK